MMAQRLAVIAAGFGSLALLIAALAFQYIGGLAPCELCVMQRWPHVAAVIFMVVWLIWPSKIWLYLGALAVLTSAGIGIFHTGVEQGWWEYLSSCTQGSLAGESAAALLPGSGATVTVPVRCDRIAWDFMGLSMATCNAIASVILALIWLRAANR